MMSEIRRYLGWLKRRPAQKTRDKAFINTLKDDVRKNPVQKRIYYFGVPEHSNLGDLAQCFCIRKYLAEKFPEYVVVEVASRRYLDNECSCRTYLREVISKQDLIVFQSGYTTQDIGGREDLMHQAVMRDFPDNRLLLFPQTVYFQSEERKKQCSDIYNAHKHLTFLARDQLSYEMAKEMFPDIPVYAYPDIVTTLIGRYSYHYERKGILFCIRNDSEKYYSDDEIRKLKEELANFGQPIDQVDTTIRAEYYDILANLQKYIEDYFDKFAHYKVIITDRYHGTIFSLIANTPVVVIQTRDHKVTTGVDWFKGIYDNQVVLAHSLDEARDLAGEFLKRTDNVHNEPYFDKEYYSKLRGLINL